MMYHTQCTPREKLLNRINEVSFAVDDILLYLDTQPCCEEAISFYQECEQERQKLLKEYAQCYGPLTVDAALEGSYQKALMALTVSRTVGDAELARTLLDEYIAANGEYFPKLV